MGSDAFPVKPGTYALLLYLPNEKVIAVGRLGPICFPAGFYIYVGSAFGPGGLSARIGRHLRAVKKCHWHIDYLREEAVVIEVWTSTPSDALKQECQWVRLIRSMPGALHPADGFGSSDCSCRAHLVYFGEKPPFTDFQTVAGKHLRRISRTAASLNVC